MRGLPSGGPRTWVHGRRGAWLRLAWRSALVLVALLACSGLRAQAPAQLQGRSHDDCTTSCHKSHGVARENGQLLRQATEQLCLGCHQATSAAMRQRAPQIEPFRGAGSRHVQDRQLRGAKPFKRVVRDGKKNLVLNMDCSACHDAHNKVPGLLRARAFDTRGQLTSQKPVNVAQVCFGCHAGLEAAPLNSSSDPDVGARFSPGVSSGHRLGKGVADRMDLPSLRNSTFKGKLDCTSCHDSPDSSGARGPHGSPYPSLLKAPYGHERDAAQVGDRGNDLCFLCHDRQSIQGNQSFPLHREHLTGFTGGRAASGSPDRRLLPGSGRASTLRGSRELFPGRSGIPMRGFGEPTPCATCHEPHGMERGPALVSFDRTVVSSSSVGGVEFQRTAFRGGSCTLSCHGHDHVQARY
ncbi:MAG: hypothetical protein HY823_02180 [Acidobacteria bacterium]|nr:hypothetical protein [Acidobacteriota bacterium]